MDYGKEVNDRIASLKREINRHESMLDRVRQDLAAAEQEREECRQECGKCNDCSMCLG